MKLKNIINKVWHIFYRLLLVVLFIISTLIFILQYTFPSKTVKKYLVKYLAKQGMVVLAKNIDFKLVNGIEISFPSFKNEQIEVKTNKIILHYDVVSFLKDKKIVISEFSINHPNFILTESDKTVEKKEPPKVEEKQDSTGIDIGFLINLNNINISNASFEMRDKTGKQKIKVNDLSFQAHDLSFRNMESFSGIFSIINAGKVFYKSNDLKINTDLNLKIDINGNQNTAFIDYKFEADSLNVATKDLDLKNQNLKFDFNANYDLKNKIIDLNQFVLEFNKKQILLKMKASFNQADSKLQADIKSLDVNLATIIKEFGLNKKLKNLNFKTGSFSLKNSNLFYDLKTDEINSKLDLIVLFKKISLDDKKTNLIADNLKITLKTDTKIKNKQLLTDNGINLLVNSKNIKYKKYPMLENFSMLLKPTISSKFLPQKIDLVLNAKTIYNTLLNLDLKADLTGVANFELNNILKKGKLNSKLEIKNIRSKDFVSQNMEFYGTFENETSFEKGQLRNNFLITSDTLLFKDNDFSQDIKNISSEILLDLNNFDKDKITLKFLDFKLDSLADLNIDTLKFDRSLKYSFNKILLALDIKNVSYLVQKFDPKLKLDLKSGKLIFSSFGKGDIKENYFNLKNNLKLLISDFKFNEDFIVLDSLSIDENININDEFVDIFGDISVLNTDFNNTLKSLIGKQNVNIENNLSCSLDSNYFPTTIKIDNFTIKLPRIFTNLVTGGQLKFNNKEISSADFDFSTQIKLKDKYRFSDKIENLEGSFGVESKIKLNENVLSLETIINANKMSALFYIDSLKKYFVALNGFNTNLPLNLKLDLNSKKILSENKYNIQFDNQLEYKEMRDNFKNTNIPYSNFTIDTITINSEKLTTYITNLYSDISFDNSKFSINNLYMNLLGGNAETFFNIDFAKASIDSNLTGNIIVDLGLTVSGVDTKEFNKALGKSISSKKEKSELNFNSKFHLDGWKGLRQSNFLLDLNITGISEEDGKQLLDFINKNSKDQSISMLKNLLHFFPGLKITLFSFSLKNNFIYTLIKLYKPPILFWFPLANEIRLSKQSLKFYLDKYVPQEEE